MNKAQKTFIAVFGVIAFALAIFGTLWLAGFIFIASYKINPMGKNDWLTWWNYWQHYQGAPAVLKKLKFSIVFSGALCFGIPLLLVFFASRQKRSLHGEARFATKSEIIKAKLLNAKSKDQKTPSILVGKFGGKYLEFYGQEFVLLSAPTRSGKGVGIVIPNLLSYKDSVVVLDIKGENYRETAGFRKKHGQKVYRFSPFDKHQKTHRYNPLEYVRDNHFRVGDLQSIGRTFYPSDSGSKDKFFDDQALNLFLGLGLYLCETPELPRTMGMLYRLGSGKDGKPVKEYLRELINERNFKETKKLDEEGNETIELVPITEWDGKGNPPLSMGCVNALNRFLGTSDNTLSSILASFNAPLGLWAQPFPDAATSANDFDLRNVRKERMSIYIDIEPGQLDSADTQRLLNLFFSQLLHLNTRELPEDNSELKYQCLLVMDEFTSIGKIQIIAKGVSYIAGYNMRLLPIIQSKSQLESTYGAEDARTFVTNHTVQILFAPAEQKDANDYSEMLGYETFKSQSISKQRGKSSINVSTSDQRRALMLPQEIKELDMWKQIIVMQRLKPILCEKIKYFEDTVFTSRKVEAPYDEPYIDMDVYSAKLESRMREVTEQDAEQPIELDKLVLNSQKLFELKTGLDNDMPVEDFVDGFFDSLFKPDESGEDMATTPVEVDENGISERPSDEELAELEADPDADFDDDFNHGADERLSDEELAELEADPDADLTVDVNTNSEEAANKKAGSNDELLDLSVLTNVDT